jgi:HPt (histidine-containing phosphotransfer) domain-containing protein
MEPYLQVMASYAVNTRLLLEKAKKVNKDNLADYGIIVHGIKGSSRNICAEALGDKAEALENAADEGNLDFILNNNASFIEDAEKLICELDRFLKSRAEENPKPKKDKPESDLLKQLMAACEKYDMDGVDAAMTEIDSFEYSCDDGLADWLRENVNLMNFCEIQDKIKNIINSKQ